MKRIAFVLAFLLSAGGLSFATFTVSYDSSYTLSETYNGDGTFTATLTTVVDGTTTGDCYHTCGCSQYGCQTCSIPNCPGVHTPQIIAGCDGSTPEVDGAGVWMWDYINFSSSQQLTGIQLDTDHFVDVNATVVCSAVGLILDQIFMRNYFKSAQTLSSYKGTYSQCSPGPPGYCTFDVVSNCTVTTSPPTWNPNQIVDSGSPLAAWWSSGLCERLAPSSTWVCEGIPGSAMKTPQTTPGVCSKY